MDIETIDIEGYIEVDSQICENLENDSSDNFDENEGSDLGENSEAEFEGDSLDESEGSNLGGYSGCEFEGHALNDSITPKEGMLFSTSDKAYKFYNRYALKTRFGTRKSSTGMSRTDRTKIIGRKYVCSKQGKGQSLTKNNVAIDGCYSREIRVGCKVMMSIRRLTESEGWKVSKFISEHNNHELSTPSKAAKHRSHRKVHRPPVVKNLITKLHSEGISNAGIASVVNTFEPGPNHIITSQQVHDHVRIERKNNLGKNCAMIVQNFMNKKAEDAGFFSSIELTDDHTLRSVFWADRRSQESYKKFSDVIIFDITYRTNNFSLPLAPFTGINHHCQSSLFGCALLADETEETFVWLFEQWLKCMGGKTPMAIITDQDAAMGNAIGRVFPNTIHRYCDWHLDRNIGENLIYLKAAHGPDFELYINKLRSSSSLCEAEDCWKELMTRYNLREKSWLPKLWERRQSWVPCYLKDTFVAGTRTSQRSESINAFFDTYVNGSTIIHDFVVQYDKALASRRRAEEDEDFKTMNLNPVPTLGWSVEAEAGKCYTRALFTMLHKELKDGVIYWEEKIQKEGTITTFKVGRPEIDKSQWKIVTYDSDGVFVSCQCKHFETVGLLCRHALCILWKKHISKIPDRYILKRCTIECRYQSVDVEFGNDVVASDVDHELLWGIRHKINKGLEEAYKSSSLAEEIDNYLTRKLAQIDDRVSQEQNSQVISGCTHPLPIFV